MFKKQVTIVIILTVILSSTAFAQGEFVKPGEDAFGVSLLKSFGYGTKGFGLGLGYTIKGRFDLAFSFSNNTDSDVQAYSPSLTFYAKNSYGTGMFGAGITVGYVRSEARGNYYWSRSVEINALLLGLTMFNNFYLSQDIMLQLAGSGALWVIFSSVSDKTTGVGNLSASVVFARKRPFRPFISASVTIPEEDAYPGIGAGFVAVW